MVNFKIALPTAAMSNASCGSPIDTNCIEPMDQVRPMLSAWPGTPPTFGAPKANEDKEGTQVQLCQGRRGIHALADSARDMLSITPAQLG